MMLQDKISNQGPRISSLESSVSNLKKEMEPKTNNPYANPYEQKKTLRDQVDEVKDEIDTLKSEISSLKSKNSDLEDEMSALKSRSRNH
jgi:chromosome segregation ATPase